MPDAYDIPEAVAAPKSRRTVQFVWLIPLVAVLIGGWLAVKSIMEKGPTITITFDTADGLEAGKTKLKYKDVDLGLVEAVVLSPDASHVIVTAELDKRAEPFLLDDARFWVVSARITAGNVSGLGTLLSGSYIGVDIGRSGRPKREFTGLKEPPPFASNAPGRLFVLHADSLPSLDVGSPISFRRLKAGQVTGYELDKDGTGVTIRVFINAPYDKFVTTNTRFWQASGIDVTLDASGIKVDTQSMVSILIGGLAFETPIDSAERPQAPAKAEFRLFPNRSAALKNPETEVVKQVMVFNESVRGLSVGAPIDFRGIEFGNVTAIKIGSNKAGNAINIVVEAETYPARLQAYEVDNKGVMSEEERKALVARMIANGLRAQLRTGNLLTGQLYIAVDFFPDAPKVKFDTSSPVQEIPTIQTSLAGLQSSIASIATKVNAFPLEQIGTDLRQTLQSATKMADAATKMLQKVDTEITPEAREAIVDARKAIASAQSVLKPDSPLSQDARDAMREVERAAEAFRVLADYLERHPEALLSGKKDQKKEHGK
jgi:paraquat-inducible protein B